MSEHIENPKATKTEEEIDADVPEQKIQQIANEAAGRAAKTEKKYDADHSIFTK
jgi:hypothetical protein